MNIVWFKRDLRTHDHKALVFAMQDCAVLPLYILEPNLWREPDMSQRHYAFLIKCLKELDHSLQQLGLKLVIKVGEAVDVLNELTQRHRTENLYAHQETGNGWTYRRDQAVKQWCQENGIRWFEPTQNGVIRRLKDRDGWAARWYQKMKQPIWVPTECAQVVHEPSDPLPDPDDLGIKGTPCPEHQTGGRTQGLALLRSFLHQRGAGYTKEMSSPMTAYESCSRLSAHLAFGTLSIREVFQACEQQTQAIRNRPYGTKSTWPSAMRSFSGRLRWHCHFIQKLEDEPRIEFENMHKAYDTLRIEEFNEAYFHAWQTGMTGYPMVDACMRALTATGWLNFRMRAMLMSFASYHLWLPWQKTALHLARLFTDYEPGIHYPQAQMQSGTTGINAIRIYNPIKQGVDHDPEGVFLRRWLPELRDMPQSFIHTPWLAETYMNDYPLPIVEEKAARKRAASQLYGLRKNNTDHKEIARKIVSKHGSRKSGLPRTLRKKPTRHHNNTACKSVPLKSTPLNSAQGELFL